TGTLVYTVPAGGARIHLQAGCAVINPTTKKPEGPVLRTVTNMEPRSASDVVEHFDGYEEGGTIYIPDLPNFRVSMGGTLLVSGSIITVGNHETSFISYVRNRGGKSFFPFGKPGPHHAGLSTLANI